MNPIGIWAVAGEHRLDEIEGKEQERRVIKTVIHPDYKPGAIYNDIAIVQVSEPFIFNDFVSPVKLPLPQLDIVSGSAVTVTGWGLMKVSLDRSDIFAYWPAGNIFMRSVRMYRKEEISLLI